MSKINIAQLNIQIKNLELKREKAIQTIDDRILKTMSKINILNEDLNKLKEDKKLIDGEKEK